jgi:branched-chain amino acid transport system permease protein
MISTIVQQVLNSLSLGSVYALVAIGITMIYGVLRILHIANAGVYVAGAYIGLFSYQWTHNFLLAVAVAMFLSGLLGIGIERFVYRPMIPLPRTVALIASIGLFIFISDLARMIAGPLQIPFPLDLGPRVSMGKISLSRVDILIYVVTLVIFVILWIIMNKTKIGYAIRAISQDLDASKIVGINVDKAIQVVFFIGSAISSIAGILVGVLYNAVYPSMGDVFSYKALAIIVIGGFGSLLGAVLAGLFLGITETFMTTYTHVPLSREGIAMLFLIVLILFRPSGLFGKD